MKFTIYGDPRTKKNSNTVVTNKNGRIFVLPSEGFRNYEKIARPQVPKPSTTINWPVNIKCNYYMQTKRKVDLVNLLEGTLDLLVSTEIIADDNSTIVKTMDGSAVHHDKENPRVEIEITEV